MEVQEIIDILTKFKEGKTIQAKGQIIKRLPEGTIDITNCEGWADIPNHITILMHGILNGEEFRVKPETKLRPYKTAKEFIEDQPRHGWYVLSPDFLSYCLAQRVTDSGILVEPNNTTLLPFEHLTKEFKWYDGSPCGVLEEE